MPRLLDLFCGGGGCSVGYARAGFDVVGVDISPQPNYPFEFLYTDAITLLVRLVDGGWFGRSNDTQFSLSHFDAIHASPPCQGYHSLGSGQAQLIEATRELIEQTGLPYVIENIPEAAWAMKDPVLICGTMFDPILGVRRHRLFEANWNLRHPDWPCRHKLSAPRFDVYEHGKWRKRRFVPVYGKGGGKEGDRWGEAMGVDWMTRDELAESIPPAYAEFIGSQLLAHIGVTA